MFVWFSFVISFLWNCFCKRLRGHGIIQVFYKDAHLISGNGSSLNYYLFSLRERTYYLFSFFISLNFEEWSFAQLKAQTTDAFVLSTDIPTLILLNSCLILVLVIPLPCLCIYKEIWLYLRCECFVSSCVFSSSFFCWNW